MLLYIGSRTNLTSTKVGPAIEHVIKRMSDLKAEPGLIGVGYGLVLILRNALLLSSLDFLGGPY